MWRKWGFPQLIEFSCQRQGLGEMTPKGLLITVSMVRSHPGSPPLFTDRLRSRRSRCADLGRRGFVRKRRAVTRQLRGVGRRSGIASESRWPRSRQLEVRVIVRSPASRICLILMWVGVITCSISLRSTGKRLNVKSLVAGHKPTRLRERVRPGFRLAHPHFQ